MLFDSWYGLLRVIAVGPLAYFALVLLLRVSGKRTLAKLNAFDLIVTVALGSTLATVLLSKSVPLVEGIAGLIVLVCLQYVVAWLSVRSDRVSDLVKSEPTLLLHNGAFLPRAAWCMDQRYAWGTPNPPFRIRRREHSSGVPLPAFG